MNDELLAVVRRYVDRHHGDGVARTALPGIAVFRQSKVSPVEFGLYKPLVSFVLQGSKQVGMGNEVHNYSAGQSLMITTDVPTVSQITKASLKEPYYSLAVELDIPLIETLVSEMGDVHFKSSAAQRVAPHNAECVATLERLVQLLDRPEAVPLLGAQLLRELHYWLLAGPHGLALRALGITDSHTQRISRAVARIRHEYAQPLRIEDLAEVAGMSLSSFHQHFRSITSLTPLQYQKQLRLIEARRILLNGSVISRAATVVGYESVPQFTREYSRFFGLPPARDIRQVKARLVEA